MSGLSPGQDKEPVAMLIFLAQLSCQKADMTRKLLNHRSLTKSLLVSRCALLPVSLALYISGSIDLLKLLEAI